MNHPVHKEFSPSTQSVYATIVSQHLRAAMSAGDAVAAVRRDSCRLELFGTFSFKRKSTEENMNGRLYDPVNGRFFSPDKYVANSSFTQDFNRYSYCLNNPLKYTDPSGESISELLWLPFTFFGRIMSETFQWASDKMSGNTMPNGYFNWSYLVGRTEPGSYTTYNPANVVPYGHPLYTPPMAFSPRKTSFGPGSYLTKNFDAQPYLNKKKIKALYSTTGLVSGKPIPKENRTLGLVAVVKHAYFQFAISPSKGIHLDDGTYTKGNPGITIPETTSQLLSINNLFTGGSTMYLHEESAFTSLEQLILTLCHELVHVSQLSAMAGKTALYYFQNEKIEDNYFIQMLEHNARDFSIVFGGSPSPYSKINFNSFFPEHCQSANYKNFFWTRIGLRIP